MADDSGAAGGDLAAILQKLSLLEQKLDQANSQIDAIRELVGPFAATFPDGSMLCQTVFGTKYFIDPEDRVMAPQLVVYRQWELPLSAWIAKVCTPDTVFVDVGANIGYFTCLAASRIGRGGRGQVHAFEPNPRLADLLRRNLQINWSMAPVAFHECAIADTAGTVHLYVPEGAAANGTLSPPRPKLAGTGITVNAARLDDLIAPDVAVDLLKIDVEGHEFGVLRGAQALLARSPDIRIVMEWSPQQMRKAGVNPGEIADLLPGFRCHDIFGHGEGAGSAEPHDFAWLLAQPYCNILFSRA
ncbi:FkbM family methyltransferase [Novosphingobium sp.]|uniref:FkbM family methyltransferase n=1 Tax=Novosphingobium sp. TaxID=1874826 RepID=UPI00334253AB